MEKTIAAVDSKGGGCVKLPSRLLSILLVIAVALSLCFYSPREAKADPFLSLQNNSVGAAMDFMTLIDSLKMLASSDSLVEIKGAIKVVTKDLKNLKEMIKRIRNDIGEIKKAVRTALDIRELRETLKNWANSFEAVKEINEAIKALKPIRDAWKAMNGPGGKITEIKARMNAFMAGASALRDAVEITERLINFATDVTEFVIFIHNASQGGFVSTIASGGSNAIPDTDFITAPDVSMGDISTMMTDLHTAYCLVGFAIGGPELDYDSVCYTGSEAYCNFGNQDKRVCQVGTLEWCTFEPLRESRAYTPECAHDD